MNCEDSGQQYDTVRSRGIEATRNVLQIVLVSFACSCTMCFGDVKIYQNISVVRFWRDENTRTHRVRQLCLQMGLPNVDRYIICIFNDILKPMNMYASPNVLRE